MTLPSNPNIVSQIESYLKDISVQINIQEKFPNILISLTEAVNNAVIHGNNCNVNKNIRIIFTTQKTGIMIRVEDQGIGFEKSTICDPSCDENVEKLGGRGVFMMYKLSDKLAYYKNGSAVEMFFNL